MQALYFILAGIHFIAIAITGILWTIIVLKPTSGLKKSFRDIRAVHFGSMYLASMFLGLAFAFERLKVPGWHQAFFPAGLGLLVTLSSIGYVMPRPADLDPWYYWTRGPAKVLAIIGLGCAATGLVWTGVVLVIYAGML